MNNLSSIGTFLREAFIHTPRWVFAIFFYLLWIGIKATRERTVLLPALFIMPTVFLALKARTLISANSKTLLLYFGAFILAATISYLFASRIRIKIDKQNKLITLPGSWHTLIIVLTIFSLKYVFGYLNSQHPDIAAEYAFLETLLSGACVGFSVGRISSYVYRFIKS